MTPTIDTDKSAFQITERPVEGAKFEEKAAKEQKSAADLVAAIDKLLSVKGIKSVRWSQYAPYFNDGDECVFSANEPAVALSSRFSPEGDEIWGNYWDEENFVSSYGLYDYAEEGNYRSAHVFKLNGEDTTEIAAALDEFSSVLQSGQFDYVLKSNFGDHAQVRADKKGFEVQFMEHD